MKKIKNSHIIIILSIIFLIGTGIVSFIAYKNITGPYMAKLANSYIIFVFFFLAYVILSGILSLRKLKWTELRKKLGVFVLSFIVLILFNYFFDYIVRPSKIDLFREASTAFGTAFIFSFIDLMFLKSNEAK